MNKHKEAWDQYCRIMVDMLACQHEFEVLRRRVVTHDLYESTDLLKDIRNASFAISKALDALEVVGDYTELRPAEKPTILQRLGLEK
jgi:hypothetical protein